MLTIKEARKLQKERENRAIFSFLFWFAFISVGSFLLFYLTDITELSSVFYLVPFLLLGLVIKKTKIYLFVTKKEFMGKVIRVDIYPVKTGSIKGEHTYETRQGEQLESEIFIQGDKLRTCTIPSYIPVAPMIGVGTNLCLLRFIDEPILIDIK
ncbi:MAG: hypothetical protein J6Q89_06870 [Clostridia bacterium]|nr:hypothetical protein [Clostridia bacterium]